ncbi:MAG: alpha/beta hydrolase [Parvibaculum sp.]
MAQKLKRWQKLAFAGLLALFGLWGLMELVPAPFSRVMIAALRVSAGLEEKVVEMPFGPVRYLEGGDGPTVVLLHGIFARKEHWIDFTRLLTGRYHVIVPDLPGFGDNPVLDEGAYAYPAQLDRLAALLDAVSPGPFHLAGNSMGGQLSGLYVAQNPGRVLSLALIGSPAGVTSPRASDMEMALARGEAPLVVTREEDFRIRMDWLFPDAPYIPGPVLRTWAKIESDQALSNARIWREVGASNRQPLETLAPGLTLPSFILWCREDRIFHFSGAQVLADLLPDATLVAFSGCGHVPMLDRPAETGEAYASFLDKIASQQTEGPD